MEGDKQWSSLRKFVFEYVEIRFDAFKSIVIDFRGLIVPGHKILEKLSYILGFALISSFKYEFL